MKRVWLLGLLCLGGLGVAVAFSVSSREASTEQTSVGEVSQKGSRSDGEQAVISIPLGGPFANRESEISGLAWWGDRLILLPQYPERMGGQIFALDKSKVVDWLTAQKSGQVTSPLFPDAIALEDGTLPADIDGFEGYEAIAFRNQTAFLTIESETAAGALGYIVSGSLNEAGTQLTINPDFRAEVRPQSDSPNKSEETLLLAEAQIISIYEVNGAQLNPNPVAHSFNTSLTPTAPIPFPSVEYRLTDATALDQQNRFWAINYFYPGDRDLNVEQDPLAARYGQGATHQDNEQVERLIEFEYAPSGITITDTAPIQLALEDDARNWEGIARLDEQGFLLVTDKFPETILGFVEIDKED